MILPERNVLAGERSYASEKRRLFSVLKLLTILLVLGPIQSWAQCNCTFTIAAGSGYVNFDGAAKGVKAGDVICVNAGSTGTIQFSNIKGTATNPVTIKNCGGQVSIGGTSAQNGFLFFSSKYVHLTGTGAAGVNYGFKITATASGSQGVAYVGLSSDIEVDHMEIANTGYSGMMIKTDPSSNCADVSAVRPNFTLNNVKIHDNYIHNTGGEGIYLGDSFYGGTTVFCGQTQYCHEVRGVRIYNNRFESTARESIQVGAAVSDVEIYNNSIYNYGTQNGAEQNGGVQLGLGTSARFYNNLIKNGAGPALAIQGIGNEYIYNNVFVNPGAGGAITINTRPTPLSTDIVNKGYLGGVYLINNTFVSAATGAVVEYVNSAPGNVMYNNLVVASATKWDNTYTYTDWKRSNNVVVPVLANAMFVNAAADDYRLLAGSPAIDVGINVSAWGITKDAANVARPSGTTDDAGAYELVGATAPPTANAGADQTIQLPTSSLSIAGSGSDANGTIAGYAWTKQSGGAATLTNATISTLSLSGLVAGTYVFRLTVTDNSGLTGYDDVTVTVKPANIAPVANAGSDKSIAAPLSTLSLAGSGTDSDGTIASYSWTKQSGGLVTLLNNLTNTLSLSALIPGTYVFRLTVTDNQGATGYDDVTVTVTLATNQAPTVNAGTDQSITLPTSAVTLPSTASDSDGSITAYSWTKQSGPAATMTNANTSTLSASSMTAGTYVFRETVTDNSGATAYDDVTVVVNAAPTPTVVYRVSAGNPNTLAASPINWVADTQTSPISYLDPGCLNYTCGATTWTGTNTTGAPDNLFGPNRYSPGYAYASQMAWNFPLSSGTYDVNLYFAETPYAGGVKTAGARVFGVKMEGNTVLNNFDIYATAGMNAVKKTMTVTVTDGTLDIDFVRIVGNPQVNGIEIIRNSAGAGGRTTGPNATSPAVGITAADHNEVAPEVESDPTSVDVYPNPFVSEVNVKFGAKHEQVAVMFMSMSGEIVYQNEFNDVAELTLDTSSIGLPAGVYVMTITTEKGREVRKVLKQ